MVYVQSKHCHGADVAISAMAIDLGTVDGGCLRKIWVLVQYIRGLGRGAATGTAAKPSPAKQATATAGDGARGRTQ